MAPSINDSCRRARARASQPAPSGAAQGVVGKCIDFYLGNESPLLASAAAAAAAAGAAAQPAEATKRVKMGDKNSMPQVRRPRSVAAGGGGGGG